MGSDLDSVVKLNGIYHFNPRSPHGERHVILVSLDALHSISIHAPRMGSDNRCRQMYTSNCNFNPRSPHGERPHSRAWAVRCVHISIHAPRMGSDKSSIEVTREFWISIHAPRMGSDEAEERMDEVGMDFNPRSPHGERRKGKSNDSWRLIISIHAPRMGSDLKATGE